MVYLQILGRSTLHFLDLKLNIRMVAMFAISDLPTFPTQYLGMFTVHTKFHVPVPQ